MDAQIRIADNDDAESITKIYNQAVATKSSTADLTPVSVESHRRWLQNHPAEKYPIYIAEITGRVVGWCSLSPYRPGRLAFSHLAEISYYVDQDFLQRGIGSQLIKHAISDARSLAFKSLLAMILETNSPSIQLVEKLGFKRWGHLPNVANFDGKECGHLYYGYRVE